MYVKSFIFAFLLFLIPTIVEAQTYVYSYTDPCTGLVKNLNVPINGVTVTYFGQIQTFQPVDFTNGNFNTWANSVYNSYGNNNPCGSILGVSTSVGIAQQTALNFISIINNISAISDLQSSMGGATDILGGALSATNNEKKEQKKNKKSEKQSGGTNQNPSDNNGSNTNNSTVSGSVTGNSTSGQTGQNSNNSQSQVNNNNQESTNTTTSNGQNGSTNQSTNSNSSNSSNNTISTNGVSGNSSSNSESTTNANSSNTGGVVGNSNNNSTSVSSNGASNNTSVNSASNGSNNTNANSNGASNNTSNTNPGSSNANNTSNNTNGSNGNANNTNGSNTNNTSNNTNGSNSNANNTNGSNTNNNNGSNTNNTSGTNSTSSNNTSNNASNGSNNQSSSSEQNGSTNNQTTSNESNSQSTSTNNGNQNQSNSGSGQGNGEKAPDNTSNADAAKEEKKTNILGGTLNSVQSASGKSEGGKPTVVLSSDFAGFNFKEGEMEFGGKGTAGFTSMNWNGTRTHGFLLDYTSVIKGPNLTAFYGNIAKRRIDLISLTGTKSFVGRGSMYGTLAIGQMWSFPKVKSLKLIYLATASFGDIYEEKFLGTAFIAGGMYDWKVSKRIDVKLMNLFIYAPYVSYYNDIVLKSPYVIMPIIGSNIGITKKFKFNINFGGAYAINENVMNYTLMFGTRMAL